MPNAQFWRLWGVALALIAVFAAICLNAKIAHAETCRASYYGAESGHRTASGRIFNPMGFTIAHRTLPFGTQLRATYRGRSQIGTVDDRGPFVKGRCADLSRGLARSIGLEAVGVGLVTFERLESSIAATVLAPFRRARRYRKHHRKGRG